MSYKPPLRDEIALRPGYHSPQFDVEVALNTNESPFLPPEQWTSELLSALSEVRYNRYPDRKATELRRCIAEYHEVEAEEVFCANGSNEVIEILLLAIGGPSRKALVFEPTYALHSHICRLTSTEVVSGHRDESFRIDPEQARKLNELHDPVVTFICSPNNPTGQLESVDVVTGILGQTEGLVLVDEAYGEFASPVSSALTLRSTKGADYDDSLSRLAVVRTFSKVWSMAAFRLGYLIGSPQLISACERAALPYHLSTPTQTAGIVAMRYRSEMEDRVKQMTQERDRLRAELERLKVQTWPSEANFILFRPGDRSGREVWQKLVDSSVLIRDCSDWPGLEGCLRVTVGTSEENDRFLDALEECL
ncbi:MAG: histidinol-phosphate transaminase [Acidimicrobiales bacterium]